MSLSVSAVDGRAMPSEDRPTPWRMLTRLGSRSWIPDGTDPLTCVFAASGEPSCALSPGLRVGLVSPYLRTVKRKRLILGG